MLKYKGIDGVLLLQGSKLRDVEIAKEVAGVTIFVVEIGANTLLVHVMIIINQLNFIIMIKDLNLREGQEDLRIVEHLDMQKLPERSAEGRQVDGSIRTKQGPTKNERRTNV